MQAWPPSRTPTPVISHPGAQLTRVRALPQAPSPLSAAVGDLPSSSPTHASPCFPQKRIDHLQIRPHSWFLTLLLHSDSGAVMYCHHHHSSTPPSQTTIPFLPL